MAGINGVSRVKGMQFAGECVDFGTEVTIEYTWYFIDSRLFAELYSKKNIEMFYSVRSDYMLNMRDNYREVKVEISWTNDKERVVAAYTLGEIMDKGLCFDREHNRIELGNFLDGLVEQEDKEGTYLISKSGCDLAIGGVKVKPYEEDEGAWLR